MLGIRQPESKLMLRATQAVLLIDLAPSAGIGVDAATRGAVVVPAPRWLERIWGGAVGGMALPGRILLRADLYERAVAGELPELLRHEATHLRQWRRLGPARFLLDYLRDYLSARMVGMSHDTAYRAIRFEREARAAEAGGDPV